MAKKKLTTEQKLRKYYAKRNRKLALRIVLAAIAVALLIPAVYYGYYYVVFTSLPKGDYNPDKNVGSGYSRPLYMIHDDSPDSTYALAYYYHGCWHVVDDTQKILDNRDRFTIYKDDDEWHKGTHLQLMIIKDNYMFNNVPLSTFTLIDDRCFRDCTKKMSMQEFRKYVADRKLFSVYIFE